MRFVEPSSFPSLSPQQIHLWCANLAHPDFCTKEYRPLLSTDEVERADRYAKAVDQDRFTIQRGLFRRLLSRYLLCDPREVTLQYGPQGQPALSGPYQRNALEFNVSHSADLVLFAFAENRPVGVDIEIIRSNIDTQLIANRNFTTNERSYLEKTSPDQQRTAFFKIWVCKEAYLKARGMGISVSLSSFETLPDMKSEILMPPVPEQNPKLGWKICILSPTSDSVSAVAAPGDNWRWTGFQITPRMLQR